MSEYHLFCIIKGTFTCTKLLNKMSMFATLQMACAEQYGSQNLILPFNFL